MNQRYIEGFNNESVEQILLDTTDMSALEHALEVEGKKLDRLQNLRKAGQLDFGKKIDQKRCRRNQGKFTILRSVVATVQNLNEKIGQSVVPAYRIPSDPLQQRTSSQLPAVFAKQVSMICCPSHVEISASAGHRLP